MPRRRLAAILAIGIAVLVGAACAWSATDTSTTSNIGYFRAGRVIFIDESRPPAAATPTPRPTETETSEPTPTATPTDTPAPGPEESELTAEQLVLLDHVPSEFAASCSTPTNIVDDFAAATASLACRITSRVFVEYHQFDSRTSLNRVWKRRDLVSPTGDRCTDLDYQGTWFVDDPDKPAGRMQCWGLEDFAAVEWTHDELLIYADAYIFSRRPKTLYRAWMKAGPV